MIRHTIRSRWSSLQKTLTELKNSYQDSRSRSHFKKSWRCHRELSSSHQMYELEVVRYNYRMIIKNTIQHCNSIECKKTRMFARSRRISHHFRSFFNCELATKSCEKHEISSNTRTFRIFWDSCKVNSESIEQVDWRALDKDWTIKIFWDSCKVNSESIEQIDWRALDRD